MSRVNVALCLLAYVACVVFAVVTFDRGEEWERAVTWCGGVLFAVLGAELLRWMRDRQAVRP
jgi:uncharacterized membrane protein